MFSSAREGVQPVESNFGRQASDRHVQDQIRNLSDSLNSLANSTTRSAAVLRQLNSRVTIVEEQGHINMSTVSTPRGLTEELSLQRDVSEIKDCLADLRSYIQQEFQSLKGCLHKAPEVVETLPVPRDVDLQLSVQNQAPKTNAESMGEVNDRSKIDGVLPDAWESLDEEIAEIDPLSVYMVKLDEHLAKRSVFHQIFAFLGIEDYLPKGPPVNFLSEVVHSSIFTSGQTLLILSNTFLMGWETNASIVAALKDPQEEIAKWIDKVNEVYNIIFGVELLLRIAADRSWFFVAPHDWAWNMFDVLLVCISIVSDYLLTGLNVSFIRTLRILRTVRVARIIRVLRFFRELRQMLFAILGCLTSLAWAFVFLTMLMFMFSVLFLQGAVNALTAPGLSKVELDEMRVSISSWYSNLGRAMLGLLASVTGGTDWMDVRDPLHHVGEAYLFAFIMYMLFVTVGVMNVLTGVFLASADGFTDLDLVVQDELCKVEQFVEHMSDCWKDLDVENTGAVPWERYQAIMNEDIRLRMFLASIDMDPNHVKLVFDLLDEKHQGQLNLCQFVLGMAKLRGFATSIDAKTIVKQLGILHHMLRNGSAA